MAMVAGCSTAKMSWVLVRPQLFTQAPAHGTVGDSMSALGWASYPTGRPAAATKACLLPGRDLATTQAGSVMHRPCSALAQAERHPPASWLTRVNRNPLISISEPTTQAQGMRMPAGRHQHAAAVFHNERLTAGGRCVRLALSSYPQCCGTMREVTAQAEASACGLAPLSKQQRCDEQAHRSHPSHDSPRWRLLASHVEALHHQVTHQGAWLKALAHHGLQAQHTIQLSMASHYRYSQDRGRDTCPQVQYRQAQHKCRPTSRICTCSTPRGCTHCGRG